MSSLRRHEGYLLIDHTASPGLPEDFYRAQGIDAPAVGEGCRGEFPTITCSHCSTVVIVNPNRKRARAYCRSCDHYICDACAVARDAPDYVHLSYDHLLAIQHERFSRAANVKGT